MKSQSAGDYDVHQIFEVQGKFTRGIGANEKRFREGERRAADVIKAIINSDIKWEEDEVVNMCRSIQKMRKESERDGESKKARERPESCMIWDMIQRR